MKAIILAAGYATRLYPLTLNMPKALLPVNGKPMIDYLVEDINKIDEVDKIYVISNHKFFEHFKQWAENSKSNIPILILDDFTTSEESRRGAIGDIQFAIESGNIDDDLIITAGDNFNMFPILNYYNYFKKVKKDCICAMRTDNIEQLKSFAVAILDENNKVIELVEKPEHPNSDLAVFATYFYLKETAPCFKQYLDEGNKKDSPGNFPQWLYTRKDVYTYIIEGKSFDIGTIEMYNKVNSMFSNQEAKNGL